MDSSLDLWLRPGELTVVSRLVLATLAGAAVGWNRYRAGKPAGVGTHALVALGSALFAVIPVLAGPSGNADAVSRVIQGVATGVGFLGAGEIFRDGSGGSRVHGLTSAASLWVTAALGIIAVCCSGVIIAASTALVLFVLVVKPRFEERFLPRTDKEPR